MDDCTCPPCRGERPGPCWRGSARDTELAVEARKALLTEEHLELLAAEAAGAGRRGELQRAGRLFAAWRDGMRNLGLAPRLAATSSKFTCPSCGSHYFRTDGFPPRGYCRGRFTPPNGYTGCDFSWDREHDDCYFGVFR